MAANGSTCRSRGTPTAQTSDDGDQSSLDLSLCLRRGSNDSRDSFYMDFDRGIDSDIDVDGIVHAASTSNYDCTATTVSVEDDDDDDDSVDDNDDEDKEDDEGLVDAGVATRKHRSLVRIIPKQTTSSSSPKRCGSSRQSSKDINWVNRLKSGRNRLDAIDVDGLNTTNCNALTPSPVCPNRILASPEETLGSMMISSSLGTSTGTTGLMMSCNGNVVAGRPNEMSSSSASTSRPSPLICSADRDVCPRYEEATTGVTGLLLAPKETNHRLMYACSAQKTSRSTVDAVFDDDVFTSKSKGTDSVVTVLSGMYAKLLVVMGIAFPLAEVISPYIFSSFFVGFYLYLYSGSILFLIYAYSFLLHKTPGVNGNGNNGIGPKRLPHTRTSDNGGGLQSVLLNKISLVAKLNGKSGHHGGQHSTSKESNLHRIRVEEAAVHCGSFYLRMGAVAFGIGSMIYSGLEFGQFFELHPNSECYSVLMAVTPCAQMAFTFIQLYFIFMNSKMCIHKFKNVARFGLMHMVATNLCVWLHVLVQESKHEILKFIDPSHGGTSHPAGGGGHGLPALNFSLGFGRHELGASSQQVHHRVTRGLKNPHMGFQCRRVNIMGQLVQDVSPFLFPCTIEYSLICAAIVYMMWKNIGKRAAGTGHHGNGHGMRLGSSVSSEFGTMASRRHHYSVDCAHANKGLFTGILVFVLAIISLILFFVLINRPEYKDLAVLEAHISELVLYCLNIIAAVIALMQVRELRYSVHHYIELDNILLVVSQTGVYLFSIFCVIGGHFTISHNTVLVLLTAIANLVQATVQTIFILDASRRHASTTDQVNRKPGREMITFLLVCNLTMWAINSLEIRRSDANPTQLNFYGFWAWTIIAHVSSPLAIFFRFHSTVCLCEIWKKLYKLKAERV